MIDMKVFGRAAVAGVIALTLVSGCATKPDPNDEAAVQAYNEANDPLEPMNRYFFELNNFFDEILLKQFAGYYNIALPTVAKDSIRNALRNLNSPVILANDLFQGEGSRAGDTSMRFVINSTLGIGGLIDVAKMMGYNYHDEDFGQTLAVWGTGEGPYLTLPVIGPSNPRDLAGRGVDKVLDPLTWVGYIYDVGYINTIRSGLDTVDTRARNMQALDELKKGSIDFYATIRSLYRQQRNDAIRNGRESDDLTPAVTSENMIPGDGAVPEAGQVTDAQ
ncbi:VacJ family lipoprotein [Dongia soli]|uniref:VacJ family lipoprotein n=1 Tax=Dongia soli TaxID=600628 RepID=A0ABU5E562_9PROT|nr:VacJ family lipoprotein [Dongia soli]MDY0881306.1 VacJ family lipoprotein [Dongia soli]